MITFTVLGTAQPGGSKRALPIYRPGGAVGVRVFDANAKVKPWRQEVAGMALEVVGPAHTLLTGPLEVEFTFFRPRPKGHFGKNGLNAKGRASIYPTPKPDVLKLARAVEDALTGVVWHDDAQIVAEHLYKRWGEPARAVIVVRPLEA